MVEIQKNICLANFSTLGIGGVADYLTVVRDKKELLDSLNWALENNSEYVIIGNGSNVLFSDEGYKGLVIVNKANGHQIYGIKVFTDSGTSFSVLARETLNLGSAGLHFGKNIPGTIGGAIVCNAGALGWDISKTMISAEVWNEGKISTWENKDFEFIYRGSKLKGQSGYVVLSASFNLEKANTEDMEKQLYEDDIRRSRSYVGKTCGSFFKNPEGKIAGVLIDSLGLKGLRIGGVEVSPLHANVFRNVGNASSEDVLKLEAEVKNKVLKKYGIELETEIVKIGF